MLRVVPEKSGGRVSVLVSQKKCQLPGSGKLALERVIRYGFLVAGRPANFCVDWTDRNVAALRSVGSHGFLQEDDSERPIEGC